MQIRDNFWYNTSRGYVHSLLMSNILSSVIVIIACMNMFSFMRSMKKVLWNIASDVESYTEGFDTSLIMLKKKKKRRRKKKNSNASKSEQQHHACKMKICRQTKFVFTLNDLAVLLQGISWRGLAFFSYQAFRAIQNWLPSHSLHTLRAFWGKHGKR